MDFLLVLLLRAAFALVNALPLSLRLALITAMVRTAFALLPKLRSVSLDNLALAFPEQTPAWRMSVLRRSYGSLARMFVDFMRLPKLDAKWVASHVECPFLDRFKALHNEGHSSGIVIATGHLGSFELLAHCSAIYGYPLSFVVRNAKLPRVDAWWRSQREANGNRVISRKGAFKVIMSHVLEGRDVGILFDQNVTRNHAVFVNWFGKPAATTKSVALAALRARAPVMVASVSYCGEEKYRIDAEEFDFSTLYKDESKGNDQKVYELTAALVTAYEGMIRKSPHEWFWMHRRWRTRPDDEA